MIENIKYQKISGSAEKTVQIFFLFPAGLKTYTRRNSTPEYFSQ